MKYQALRPHFFPVVGWVVGCRVEVVVVLVVVVVVVVVWVGFGVHGVLVRDIVGGGGRMGGGKGDGGEKGGLWCGWWSGWCAGKFLNLPGFKNIWTRWVKILKVIKTQEEQVGGHRGWSKGCQALRPHFFSMGEWLEGSWGCWW